MANSCTIALSKAGTAEYRRGTNSIRPGIFFSRNWWTRMNRDESCTYIQQDERTYTMYRNVCIVYILCTHVYIQIVLHISRFIPCSDQVYTRTLLICIHVHVHTCSNIVHTMYIPNTYIDCTSSVLLNVQVQVFRYIEYKKQQVACNRVWTSNLVQTAELP